MTTNIDDVSSSALRNLVESQMDLGGASKRARAIAAIILDKGSCTTSDIEALGYKHPPRAVGDLRDSGVEVSKAMETYTDPDTGTQKRRARYSISGVNAGKTSRRPFSKQTQIAVKASGHCEICSAPPPLQVDHRIPFGIGGETYPHVPAELMPLCASCNRTKSWDCEHCPNWETRTLGFCETCLWASPDEYSHVAGKQIREIRVTLTNPLDIIRYDAQNPNTTKILIEYMSANEFLPGSAQ